MPERHIKTSTTINASPERVWSVLTDFSRMGSWNPFIRSISGELARGARLEVHLGPPGKRAMRFRPTVLVMDAARELRWFGQFFLPGLFDGEHYFILEKTSDGATRLTHGENFSGIFVGLLGKTLDATKVGFEAMNAALKKEVEAGAGFEAM